MDKEIIAQMISTIEKVKDQQSEILVKTAELALEQRHTSESITTIKEDVSDIKEVQSQHSADIADIKNKLVNHIETEESELSFKEYAKQFAMNHPIITFMLLMMLVNIILTSVGLPIVQLAPLWATLVGNT